MMNELMEHIDKLHTTEMGVARIKKNLSLDVDNVVQWCRMKLLEEETVVESKGKNWYTTAGHCKITVNASSYTIITAHRT